MRHSPKTTAEQPSRSGLARAIEHIVATTPASRLFELYYWAQEPQLLKLFRSFATLEPGTQDALVAFFQLVQDGTSVAARWGTRGELILEVKHAGEDASMHRYLAEGEEPLSTSGPKSH